MECNYVNFYIMLVAPYIPLLGGSVGYMYLSYHYLGLNVYTLNLDYKVANAVNVLYGLSDPRPQTQDAEKHAIYRKRRRSLA
jgi:hypothetical protein